MSERTLWRRLLVPLVALAAVAPAHSAAAAGTTWVVRGAGFGHGVGMSAYGAYGYAQHGFSAPEILAHYYTGTAITKVAHAPPVRVLLGTSSGDVAFKGAATACGRKLSTAKTYRARRAGSSMRLVNAGGSQLARCGKRLRTGGTKPVRIAGVGTYRGSLEATPSGGGVYIVNRVDANSYVRGVLPSEVPPSWPRPALRAFAIAMRSVGLTTHVGGSAFDVYPDTRTQLYRGVKAEAPTTDAAAKATRDQVVTYKGAIAQTTYFSSSGGRTESGFLGAPEVPYLQSVDDPYDYYSPLHRWTLRFTQAQIDARLGGYVKGSLRRMKVTKRGDSPRIVTAKLTGTGGTTSIRGDALAAALGLYSRWAYFKKVSG